MKVLDKFLKILKTDRNTFFTFILGLISIYLIVDRLTEFLLILFTGVATNYWNPLQYAVAFAFPIFTFLFGMASKFISCDDDKVGVFYAYVIALYIMVITMLTEWINQAIWLGLLSLPKYDVIARDFSYLIKPALSAVAITLPLFSWQFIFDKLYKGVNDTKDLRDSVIDYGGISLSDTKEGWGPYTNEILVGQDKEHGFDIKLPEIRRFEQTLIVGVSGAGKTSLVFEPWVAQDISKKFFYKESSKALAFGALKAGIATLNCPYDNNYINDNFNLNMIAPVSNKMNLFKSYFKKFIYSESGSNMTYRNLGITYLAPDNETIDKVKQVCDNFGMPYNLIDPDNALSPGLNPFAFDDPVQVSLAVSTILKGHTSNASSDALEMSYKTNLSNQIIENLSILLKIAYPKLNNGKLPNLNDLYKLLSDFDLVEKMCKILETDKELSKEYENQISYFKKNFYHNSPEREEMKKIVAYPIEQLDTLLRYPGVKKIICNRTNNINYDKVLENGEITLISTRRGDLGPKAHKAFGLFFLLLMQFSVLRRPGTEKTRVPHFLYIDEFPDFICHATEPIFTVYRKYRVGTVISAQNLSQLRSNGDKLGDTIIANCSNKIVFGGNNPEDNDWWSKEIGNRKEWVTDVRTYDAEKGEYESKIKTKFTPNQFYKPGKVQSLKFKNCAYKLKDIKGGMINGTAVLDFIPAKYNEKQKVKNYNFTKYSAGISNKEDSGSGKFKLPGFKKPVTETGFESEGPIRTNDGGFNFNLPKFGKK